MKQELEAGSYVTMKRDDAIKNGYRKAVINNSDKIYLYKVTVESKDIYKDTRRIKGYLTRIKLPLVLVRSRKFKG